MLAPGANMPKIQTAYVIAILSLPSCRSYNVQVLGTIDAEDKSITTPTGAGGAMGQLKNALRNAGWSVFVGAGPTVTEGTAEGSSFRQVSGNSRTRYELICSWTHVDTALFTGTPLLAYDIGIVDLRTGLEVASGNAQNQPVGNT